MSLKNYALPQKTAWQDAAGVTPSNPILAEIIAALAPHPRGLRRWSVMRAIRSRREAISRDIPLKLEADVERIFRQFCSGICDTGMREVTASEALFYRPKEKAGEVWALRADYSQRRATSEPGE